MKINSLECRCQSTAGIPMTVAVIAFATIASLAVGEEVGTESIDGKGTRRALIVVGLPGDREHEELFRTTASLWKTWLTEKVNFSPENVDILDGGDEPGLLGGQMANKDAVTKAFNQVREEICADDTWWVLWLGHGNHDGRRGWFHLPGPDINDIELAELCAGIECQEQVFWLTHTCSGWFLKSLSRPGRTVITATAADNELNETEFPHALATVGQRELVELDGDGDEAITLSELFVATVAEVDARFASDNRAATEHAQLDDNGDGRGTEAPELGHAEEVGNDEGTTPSRRDGSTAAKVQIPWQSQQETVGVSNGKADTSRSRPPTGTTK